MSLFNRPPEPDRRAITHLPWTPGNVTDAGISVTERSALQLSAVWACVSLLSDLVASMPAKVYKDVEGLRTPVRESRPIVERPSLRGLNRRDWLGQAMLSLLLRGNAYGLKVGRDPATGHALSVEWLHPDLVSVEELTTLAMPVYRYEGRTVPSSDLVHLRAHTRPGSVVGMSPIEFQAQTIGLALATQRFASQWFGQGAHPSAILSTDQKLDEDGAQAMKDRFMASIRGRREPAALGMGIKYTPIQVNPDESQFLETQQMSINDIARIFKVPAELIGGAAGGSSVTYANREQRSLDLLTFAVAPWIAEFEEMWADLLPGDEFVRFNLDALLRSDLKTRYEAHARGIAAGFLTVNEARIVEDLAPQPELPEPEPEVATALNLASKAPSLIQNPGLPVLVDQLRILNGKPPLNPTPPPTATGDPNAA